MKKNNNTVKLILFFLSLFFIACSSTSFEELHKQALHHIKLDQYEQAESVYLKLIDEHSSHKGIAVVYFEIGNLYKNLIIDYTKALEAYYKCIEASPYSKLSRLSYEKRAEIFEIQGDKSGFIQEYEALNKYFPSDYYKLCLAEGYISAKNYAQARIELDELVKKDERAIFDMGETYFLDSKPGIAKKYYNEVVKVAKDKDLVFEARFKVALCFEEMGYIGQAYKALKNLEKEYPNKELIKKYMHNMQNR